MKRVFLVLLSVSLLASAKASDDSIPMPFGFSFVTPLQFPAVNENVDAFRFNILAGSNYDVSFLDIGGVANFVDGNLMGLEIAGLCNNICTSDGAFQIAGLVNLCQMGFTGFQVAGFVNKVNEDFTGFQIGCINMAEYVDGVQIGAVNKGGSVRGLQIGAFNMATDLVGVQIGVFNYVENSEVPFMPVLNAHF